MHLVPSSPARTLPVLANEFLEIFDPSRHPKGGVSRMIIPTSLHLDGEHVFRRTPMPMCSTNFWQCNPGVGFVVACSIIIGICVILFAYRKISGTKVRSPFSPKRETRRQSRVRELPRKLTSRIQGPLVPSMIRRLFHEKPRSKFSGLQRGQEPGLDSFVQSILGLLLTQNHDQQSHWQSPERSEWLGQGLRQVAPRASVQQFLVGSPHGLSDLCSDC